MSQTVVTDCVCVCFVQSSANNRGGALSDAEALSQIMKGHDTMCVMLSSRHKNLETVRAVWAREDIKVRVGLSSQSESCCRWTPSSSLPVSNYPQSALDTAVAMNDLSIVVDILNIINLQPSVTRSHTQCDDDDGEERRLLTPACCC